MPEWSFVAGGEASRVAGDAAETRAKLRLLRQAMFGADLDAVYLERWANVAWLCGGRGNRVVRDIPEGLCGVLVGHNGAWLLTPNNEEARMRAEAFAGLELPVVSRAWYELPLWRSALPRVPEGAPWAADIRIPGAADAEPLMAPLRRHLDGAEQARYRALGRDTAEALESALLEVTPGWSELHVAAAIAAELLARDIDPAVLLVGSGERALRFRHPVPMDVPAEGSLIASVTAVRFGLHASTTRCVSFGPAPAPLRDRHMAAANVDAMYLSHSRPGATLGDVLEAGEEAYEFLGYYDDWKEHHQGGTTGYAGRELFALPGSEEVIAAGNAVAWNPTVPGAKSEDTVLVTEQGLELLTSRPDSPWPVLIPEHAPGIPRLGLLQQT